MAQLFDHLGRVMADAIDREHHQVGLAGKAGKQVQMVLDAAVMVQERGARPLCAIARRCAT